MNVETVPYIAIIERCKVDAMEYLPDLPKENTVEAWESFLDELETIRDDSYYHAGECVQQWDWAIYTHYGWKILFALPSDIERQAESEFFDVWGQVTIYSLNGWWEMASMIACFALEIIFRETLEEMAQELIELAESQLENMESV